MLPPAKSDLQEGLGRAIEAKMCQKGEQVLHTSFSNPVCEANPSQLGWCTCDGFRHATRAAWSVWDGFPHGTFNRRPVLFGQIGDRSAAANGFLMDGPVEDPCFLWRELGRFDRLGEIINSMLQPFAFKGGIKRRRFMNPKSAMGAMTIMLLDVFSLTSNGAKERDSKGFKFFLGSKSRNAFSVKNPSDDVTEAFVKFQFATRGGKKFLPPLSRLLHL